MNEQVSSSKPKYVCPNCGMKFYTDRFLSCPKCFVRLIEAKKKIRLKL